MRKTAAGVLVGAALLTALPAFAQTQTVPSHDGWDSWWHDWWHPSSAPAHHSWDGWLHDWWHSSDAGPGEDCRIVTANERRPDGKITSHTPQQC
jgi:hypothetical protein